MLLKLLPHIAAAADILTAVFRAVSKRGPGGKRVTREEGDAIKAKALGEFKLIVDDVVDAETE